MGFELSLISGAFDNTLMHRQAVNEVMNSNALTARYGLVLTEPQALALVETRTLSLRETGRIEFGGGIIDKLLYVFCDSPYLCMQNYEEIIHSLIETFYYYKNETLDLVSDDDLIHYMKKSFDGVCQGSIDLLAGRELDCFARNVRYGTPIGEAQKADTSDEEDDDDEY